MEQINIEANEQKEENLFRKFKAECKLQGKTQKEILIGFMLEYIGEK